MKARKKTSKIIIHHSASPKTTTRDQIYDWHVNGNGWSDIGYHFIISGSNGKLFKGRDIHREGAHCPAVNSHSIGICITGNYEVEHVDKPAWEALLSLLNFLFVTYDLTWNDVEVHRDHGQTACPGKNLWALVKDKKQKG